MKNPNLISIVIVFVLTVHANAQVNKSVKFKDLAAPTSPAFVLTDVAQSSVATPNIPKEFILGVVQSFGESSNGFPANYSAEFAPYWWINDSKRSFYGLAGLKTPAADDSSNVRGQAPFSGLKFVSVSLAFLSKDLIPDPVEENQKIISGGLRVTAVKIHRKSYVTDLDNKIREWHKAAQAELEAAQEELTREQNPTRRLALMKKLANYKPENITNILEEINDILNRKPTFSWDIAAATAVYGINDDVWKTGRSGIWTSMSTYVPLDLKSAKKFKNYFNLNVVFRYISDKYQLSENNAIESIDNIDFGGKIAFEFERLSIGYELLKRFTNGRADGEQRSVGVINYKIADNIYLRGAFGKNFDTPGKLVSLIGINWGFGSETISLPD